MVFNQSLFTSELGAAPEGRWGRLTRKVLISLTREANWRLLSALQIREIDQKLTPATTFQEECLHVSVRERRSEWNRSLYCRRCNWRLWYIPTFLAAVRAHATWQRRITARQQAGRLALAARVSQAVSATQTRERAADDVQAAAVEEVQPESQGSQLPGLQAVAEALNRLIEQSVTQHRHHLSGLQAVAQSLNRLIEQSAAQHHQTLVMMERILASSSEAQEEEEQQSVSSDQEWAQA